MAAMRRLVDSWDALPVGARAALDQQWAALAAVPGVYRLA